MGAAVSLQQKAVVNQGDVLSVGSVQTALINLVVLRR